MDLKRQKVLLDIQIVSEVNMKIRNGFVSNSSSSSFIVAVDADKSANVEVAVKVNLADFGDVLKTEQEVHNAFNEYWGKEELEEDDWVGAKYRKAIAAIKAGKVIVFGQVSNEDTPEEYVIYEKGIPETEGMEIIQNVDY